MTNVYDLKNRRRSQSVDVEEKVRSLQFNSERERELFVEAQFGEEVIDFLHTDVGQYLLGVANQEMDISKQKMAELDPTDPRFKKKYAGYRFNYDTAAYFPRWLGEVITRGQNAAFTLENEDYDNG
jgi:hypothetical protein